MLDIIVAFWLLQYRGSLALSAFTPTALSACDHIGVPVLCNAELTVHTGSFFTGLLAAVLHRPAKGITSSGHHWDRGALPF